VTYLFAPDGTYITLSAFNGEGANFANTTFDDQASMSIGAGTPRSQARTTLEPLATFDGKNARGHVDAVDRQLGFSTGTLNSWSLTILPGSGAPPTPPPPTPPPAPPPNQPPMRTMISHTNEDAAVNINVLATTAIRPAMP